MAEHNDIGSKGELMARSYLEDSGYDIIATNWRLGHHEIDIIAGKDQRLVFVEVKTRASADYGAPEAAVDKKKQRAYIRMANNFIISNKRTEEARFDIITILNEGGEPKLHHIVDAYNVITALSK